jgi:hypothetical protein
MNFRSKEWIARRGGFPTKTPFEKGKPIERSGRKATGLRADLPRQLMPAGCQRKREHRTMLVQIQTSKGGPLNGSSSSSYEALAARM